MPLFITSTVDPEKSKHEVMTYKTVDFWDRTTGNKYVFVDFGFLHATQSRRWYDIALFFILLSIEPILFTFCKFIFVMNIFPHTSGWSSKLHTKSGSPKLSLVRDTQYFNTIRYNPYSIVNNIFLANTRKLYRVKMNLGISPTMHVYLPNDLVMSFYEIYNGLYCHDTCPSHSYICIFSVISYSLVNTVSANKVISEHLRNDAAKVLKR